MIGAFIAMNAPFRFGNFEFDLKNAALRRDGQPVRLRPQAFKILALLVTRAGELVTREEIRTEIWSADTFVDFNQGLNACIKQVREALDDDAESPRFVETVPRLGYRFIARLEPVAAPVTEEAAAAAPASPPRRAPWGLRLALVAAAVVVIVALGTWRFWPAHAHAGRAAAVRSIAVLPLVNLAADAEHAYLADGMTEALINELARVRGLRVISRTSSMQYRDTRKPIPEIAEALHVDAVIEGSVQQSADRVRTTVQLIDAATDQPLWASSYDRKLGDVLTLQREVADAVVSEIRAEVPTAGGPRPSPQSANPVASEAYLKGRFFWNKRSQQGYELAIEQFQEVIRLDPSYAPAYAGLADALALYTNSQYLARDVGYSRARQAALKALGLDETLAEAHTSLGFILHKYDFDWAGAEREFVRAIELNPSYATAHHWRALNFQVQGRAEDGYTQMKDALALDPLSFAINVDFATTLTMVGRCDEAFEHATRTVQMHGDAVDREEIPAEMLVLCGRDAQAIPRLEKAFQLKNGYRTAAFLGYAYARTGRTGESRHLLEILKRSRSTSQLLSLAEIHGALGEIDAAFDDLERLYQSKDERLLYLKTHTMLDPLRFDPRFESLLRRMNLPAGR